MLATGKVRRSAAVVGESPGNRRSRFGGETHEDDHVSRVYGGLVSATGVLRQVFSPDGGGCHGS